MREEMASRSFNEALLAMLYVQSMTYHSLPTKIMFGQRKSQWRYPAFLCKLRMQINTCRIAVQSSSIDFGLRSTPTGLSLIVLFLSSKGLVGSGSSMWVILSFLNNKESFFIARYLAFSLYQFSTYDGNRQIHFDGRSIHILNGIRDGWRQSLWMKNFNTRATFTAYIKHWVRSTISYMLTFTMGCFAVHSLSEVIR